MLAWPPRCVMDRESHGMWSRREAAIMLLASPVILASPAGANVALYTVPTPNSAPESVTVGPDGNIWFTEAQGNKIGRITPSGAITEYPVAIPQSYPFGITAGPDEALWFTSAVASTIGRISIS